MYGTASVPEEPDSNFEMALIRKNFHLLRFAKFSRIDAISKFESVPQAQRPSPTGQRAFFHAERS